jgi:hypothetical protein
MTAAAARRTVPLACGAVCLALCGCTLLLGLQPLEVSNWHPRESRLTAAAAGTIWVEFSADVDRTKAEEAFSLSENTSPMPGSFSWSGNRVTFTPSRPLTDGNDYELAVLSSAETRDGNSLKKDFRFAFTTRSESGRPTVVGITPADGSRVSNALQPVVVQFSEPADQTSFLAAWSVSPDPGGSISFDVTGAIATYTPLSEWQPGTEYSITVSDAFTDRSGNHLASSLRTRFTAGSDNVRPNLVAVYPVTNGTPAATPLTAGSATAPATGIEATMGLQIVFDKAVQRQNLESFIDIEPAWGFQLDPSGLPQTSFTLTPTERFVYGTLYRLVIKHGVLDTSGNATAADTGHFFRVDGPTTKPPSVKLVLFNGDTTPLAPFGNLVVAGGSSVVFFDLYFDIASDASIDPFSLMHAFTITTTNGAFLTVTPTAIETGTFADPQPAAEPGLVPARITVSITNSPNSGIVTLGVAAGFTDSAGNVMSTAYSLPLLK